MRTSDATTASTGSSPNDTAKLPALAPGASTAAATPAPARPAPQRPVTRDTLEAIAASIQAYLQRNGRNLEFRVDDATGHTVITVRDASTGDVIRQIPNEEALAIAQRLTANSGTLVDAIV